jgi:GMP synthase-like glutamine amidotransferase
MKKLAIIDNSLWPELYNPVEHWAEYIDLPCRAFRATEGMFPDLDDGYTHLIISGSEASIIASDPWVLPEVELVKEAMDRKLTLLGSCYGHQLLALALGGSACVRRTAVPEIGWIEVEILKDDPLLGLKQKISVFSSHYDEVCNLKEDKFEILARSQKCQVQAFRLKGKKVWGIQAHPEINPEKARKLLTGIIQKNFSQKDLIEKALNSKPVDSGWINLIKKNFIAL